MGENNMIFNFHIYMVYIIVASEIVCDKESFVKCKNKNLDESNASGDIIIIEVPLKNL